MDFLDGDILRGLNEQQKEAVTATEGFVRVIAGAGSGKTRALSHRFAYLVTQLGILPGNILCVTFTNKAANEMRRRIHRLTGDNDTGFVSTFHGFCVSILQEDSHAIGYPRSFLVLDNFDIDAMLAIVYEERGLTLRDMTFGKARDMIEMQKLVHRPDYYLDVIERSPDELRAKYLDATETRDIIFYGYLWQQKKCFGLDYNDLLKFTLYIFRNRREIALKWQQRLEYIMIDEFQDIDDIQYELMQVLCAYHRNLFIVGDPDQTIYTWRGANISYLLDFDKVYPDTRTIMMMTNYRSTPQVLSVANCLISRNHFRMEKELMPTLPAGEVPMCFHADTAEEEAAWVVRGIQSLLEASVPARDITVLYRAHYLTRTLEDELRRVGLPYQIYSGTPFYNRMEIKDALSYLRMVAYRDDLAFVRVVNVPKRNIGKMRMARLTDYAEAQGISCYEALKALVDTDDFKGTGAAKFIKLIEKFSSGYEDGSISELMSAILHESGYEEHLRREGSQERLDNLAELKQSIYEYETTCGEEATLTHYLAHIALFTNSDTEEKGDRIKLMTVHAAKGLEFPYVFIIGLNEGIFPSKKTSTLPGMEEERRLAFVAMTRAERGLFLSEARGRNLDGSYRYPSRFILDIDPALVMHEPELSEDLLSETRSYVKYADSHLGDQEGQEYFDQGSAVVHPVFGVGEVLEVDMDKKAYLIKFESMDTPRRIAMRAVKKEE